MGNETIRMGKPIEDRGMTWYGPVRVAYVHVDEPSAPKGLGDESKRYKLVMMVPKEEAEAIGHLNAAYQAAVNEGVAKLWKGKMPPKLDSCVRDGDGTDNPDFRGFLLVSVKSKYRPQVFDPNRRICTTPGFVYSGCYAWVRIAFLPFDVAGNKGVMGVFNDVMFARDGERFGGMGTTEDQIRDLPFTGLQPSGPAGFGQQGAVPGVGGAPAGFGQQGAAPGFGAAPAGGGGSFLPF